MHLWLPFTVIISKAHEMNNKNVFIHGVWALYMWASLSIYIDNIFIFYLEFESWTCFKMREGEWIPKEILTFVLNCAC